LGKAHGKEKCAADVVEAAVQLRAEKQALQAAKGKILELKAEIVGE
jgi:hypothetical protein